MRLAIWILALMVICFLAGLIVHKCQPNKMDVKASKYNFQQSAHTWPMTIRLPAVFDTAHLEKIRPIRIYGPVAVPAMTSIQTVLDSAARNNAEKGIIITGIIRAKAKNRHERDSLQIHRITPTGVKIMDTYSWDVVLGGKFQIDSTGLVHVDMTQTQTDIRREKRKRIWRKAGNAAITVTAAIGAFILGQQLPK